MDETTLTTTSINLYVDFYMNIKLWYTTVPMTNLLDKANRTTKSISRPELSSLLAWPDAEKLFAAAYAVKTREVGRSVSFRSLVECGNVREIETSNPQLSATPHPADHSMASERLDLGLRMIAASRLETIAWNRRGDSPHRREK